MAGGFGGGEAPRDVIVVMDGIPGWHGENPDISGCVHRWHSDADEKENTAPTIQLKRIKS